MRSVVRTAGRVAHGRGWVGLAFGVLCGVGLGQGTAIDPAYPPSYFEFGMVVALGQRDVEVQTFDENKRKLVQHSFALTRETRADRVQVGDAVEVIYVSGGTGWTLRRLILLSGGLPMMGPPTSGVSVGGSRLPTLEPAPAVPATKAVTLGGPTSGKRGSGAGKTANLAAAKGKGAAAQSPGKTQPVALAGAPAASRNVGGEVPVVLGNARGPKVAEVVAVPLGGPDGSVKGRALKEKAVVLETPSEECNRSSVDWPGRPLSLAVLDFRYPTEREEAHDLGRTSGGSGTAMADLVFARLEGLPDFALSRGDRQKLYKADFAGAARVGRQLGVDAVLAGTFVPVEEPVGPDGFAVAPRLWELRAGLVDTCTGQLLMRLYSATCGGEPGVTDPVANEECRRLTVTAAQAADPQGEPQAFKAPLDAMLYTLEHNATSRPLGAGTVAGVAEGRVTLRLNAGIEAKVGDVFMVRARRLAKNPATYTLQNLHDEEIGRVTLGSVREGMAVGVYRGDIPARVGDSVELVTR